MIIDKYGYEIPEGFIIFQDVDGPLVSYGNMERYEGDRHHKFKPEAVDALNAIIDYYDASLCMISAWNVYFDSNEEYSRFMLSRGIHAKNLFKGDRFDRSEYVLDLMSKGLEHFLIIDDEAYEYYEKMGDIPYKRILMPNRMRCLDEHDVWTVTKNFELNV